MLKLYGIGTQPATWHVLEPKPVQYVRVYWILGGSTRFYSGGVTLPLLHNHLYLFPTRVPYEITTDPADPLSCLHLDLQPADAGCGAAAYPGHRPG